MKKTSRNQIIAKSNKSNLFLDVGANNGISSLGFELGYENPIYMFEPNKFILKFLPNLNQK